MSEPIEVNLDEPCATCNSRRGAHCEGTENCPNGKGGWLEAVFTTKALRDRIAALEAELQESKRASKETLDHWVFERDKMHARALAAEKERDDLRTESERALATHEKRVDKYRLDYERVKADNAALRAKVGEAFSELGILYHSINDYIASAPLEVRYVRERELSEIMGRACRVLKAREALAPCRSEGA